MWWDYVYRTARRVCYHGECSSVTNLGDSNMLAYRVFASFVLVTISFLTLSVTALAIDLPASGLQAYQAGNYKTALPLLDAAAIKNPRDGLTHYYLANCLVKLGENERAIEQYRKVLTETADERLKGYCTKEISQLNQEKGNFAEWESKADSRKPPKDLVHVPEPHWNALTETDLDMISFKSRCSWADRAYKDVLWGLSSLPPTIKNELHSKKVSVALCTSLADEKTAERAGQLHLENGWTWDNILGLTNNNRVTVAETFFNGNIARRPGKVLFHEFGHAFDFTHGKLNSKAPFATAFARDKANLGNAKPWKQNELFAQIFADQLLSLLPPEQRYEHEPPTQKEIGLIQHPRLASEYPESWAAMETILAPYLTPARDQRSK